MNRCCVWMTGFALLAGCGGAPAPPPLPEVPADPSPQEEPEDTITMSGINLFIHDSKPTVQGADRKPLFWLHADKYQMEGTVWWVETARAVIYGQQEGSVDVVLDATRGRFDEGKGAFLKDGVVATMDDIVIEMQDVNCVILEDESLGEASSDNPVKVRGNDIQLDAGTIRIYPENREIELTDIQGGFIRLGSSL